MPRQPRPWYWTARKAWYCQLKGKQIRLGQDRRDAEREFYRLMAAHGKLDLSQAQAMTVADACEAQIAQASHHRRNTINAYIHNLTPFAEHFGGRVLSSVRPDEAIRFVSEYQGKKGRYSESSRALMFRHIKSLYKWARDCGVADVDPFARVQNPWRIQERTRPMTEEEYQKVMRRRTSKNFKEMVEFCWRTGARPGELASLSARHLDANRPIARLQPTEHKTGTRTGLQREIYFPADLWNRLQEYATLRPNGPLLVDTKGGPWTEKRFTRAFSRLKRNMGLACVLYQARHSFLTRLIESGVPLARAAKIAGHTSTAVLTRTYYHPDTDRMIEDVTGVTTETKKPC